MSNTESKAWYLVLKIQCSILDHLLWNIQNGNSSSNWEGTFKSHLVWPLKYPIQMFCCAVLSCSVMSDSFQLHGLSPTRLLCPWGFSRQGYWSGLACPSPGDIPDPGIEPRSPIFQADSLPSEPPGKPKNTRVGSLSLLQWILPIQESHQGLLNCRQILYHMSYQGSPNLDSERF